MTDLRYEMENTAFGIRLTRAVCIDSDAVYQISASAGDWKARRGGLPDLSYPSMQFVLEPQEFGKFVENVNRRMQEKWSREDEWETELTKEEEDGDEESDDHE